MQVCIAAYDVGNNTGGVNSWVFRFLRELKAQGWQPSVCLYSSCEESERGTLEQFIVRENIPYARNRYELPTEVNVKFTVNSVRALGADVFITNCMVPAWYAAPQLERHNIPCVGVNHSDDPFYHALTDHCIDQNGWYPIAGLIAVSKYLETLTNQVASPRTHVARIPCGIDPPNLESFTHNENQRNLKQFKIAYVGRFVEEQKRISLVAESLCAAAANNKLVEGYFIGRGEDHRIQEVIDRTQTGSQVKILGWMPENEVVEKLSSMNAIALLSDYEGLPVCLMEAMSVGVIPICTPMKSGIDELVQHDSNGLIVEGNPESFVAATQRLVQSNDERVRLSQAACTTITESFLNSKCTRKWMDVLQQIRTEFTVPRLTSQQRRLPPIHPALTWCDTRETPLSRRFIARVDSRVRKLSRSIKKRIAPKRAA